MFISAWIWRQYNVLDWHCPSREGLAEGWAVAWVGLVRGGQPDLDSWFQPLGWRREGVSRGLPKPEALLPRLPFDEILFISSDEDSDLEVGTREAWAPGPANSCRLPGPSMSPLPQVSGGCQLSLCRGLCPWQDRALAGLLPGSQHPGVSLAAHRSRSPHLLIITHGT